MKKLTRAISVFAIFASSFAFAADRTNDTDLAPARKRIQTDVPLTLSADQVKTTPGPAAVQVLRQDHGKLTPVQAVAFRISNGKTLALTDANGSARLTECTGGTAHLETELTRDARFSITNGTNAYRIAADVPCEGTTQLLFSSDSNAGQALGIWQIAYKAETKLAAEIGLDFWTSPLTFVWPDPDGGDYYSNGEVHISQGDHWDVVGHEMGHGIYALGGIGDLGGGQHKIDECYDETLAFSEGWASFFSGWVNVDLADPDAKFEYMVPRRAPIRFENIPADVCKGETNEWRVIGFFWDIVDTHDDGEKVTLLFSRMWKALQNAHVTSATEARLHLEAAGISHSDLQTLWDLNFQK